jgi:hypothetical protein
MSTIRKINRSKKSEMPQTLEETEILCKLQTIENPSNIFIQKLKKFIDEDIINKKLKEVEEKIVNFIKNKLDVDITMENFNYSGNKTIEYDDYVHTNCDYNLSFEYDDYKINIEYFENNISMLHNDEGHIEDLEFNISLTCNNMFKYSSENIDKSQKLEIINEDIDIETLKLGFLLLSSFTYVEASDDCCIILTENNHIPYYSDVLKCNTVEDFQNLFK